MTDPYPFLALLERTRRHPGFRGFVSIVGQRARAGRSWEAFLMLREIGAPARIAHNLAEGWPREVDPRLAAHGCGLEDLEAVWLAQAVDDLDRYDWPRLLQRAARRADAERRAANPEEGSCQGCREAEG